MRTSTLIGARLRAVIRQPEAHLRRADRLASRGAGPAAVGQIAAAARDGLPEAQSRLGLCYLRGLGVPADQAEARYWLECAAAAGDAAAQTALATLAMHGMSGPYRRGPFSKTANIPTEPDRPLAAGLARRAAHAGSAEAQALLAFIIGAEPGLAETPGEADALYRASAAAGWPMGQLGHAIGLLRQGSPDAAREAHALLLAAAEAGLPTADYLLAVMAEAGVGNAPDLPCAAIHYRTAAELGHTQAKARLGLALLAGRGVPRNPTEAQTWLQRAARDGDVTSAAVLGDFHASAEWQPPDLEQAAQWYRRAAELGHPGSAHILARAILAGAEGKPDPREIVDWLEKAIERGDPTAWPDLGSLIASLALPPEQLPVLHEWLQRMIREDRPEAGFYVGVCVNCGIGTPADESLARQYYLWAAGEGVIDAMVAAAEMLANGRGGGADPTLARALFEYAAKRQHVGAIYALGVLAGGDRDRAMAYFHRAAALGHVRAKLLLDEPVA